MQCEVGRLENGDESDGTGDLEVTPWPGGVTDCRWAGCRTVLCKEVSVYTNGGGVIPGTVDQGIRPSLVAYRSSSGRKTTSYSSCTA